MPDKEQDFTGGTYSKLVEVSEQKKGHSAKATVKPSNRDTTVQPVKADNLIEFIRKSVKQIGKEAATYRFTAGEKEALAEMIFTFRKDGVRVSENEITRVAVNALIHDFKIKGKDSTLSKVLEQLNA